MQIVKKAARIALHPLGGLRLLRLRQAGRFGVPMFHSFEASDRARVEQLCAHLARHFEPLPMSRIVDTLAERKTLPRNAITVTVDDGYRNFLEDAHPILRRHHIPATLYAVSAFAAGRIWLWTDQVAFALTHSAHSSLRVSIGGTLELELDRHHRAASIFRLTEKLKTIPNEQRRAVLDQLPKLCSVELPPTPPPGREAATWDQLRALASDGVEIGCHTATHPILSRLADSSELLREIRGAKDEMTERLGLPVRHFCYPNGLPADIGDAAIGAVRDAGFISAVTCSYGFNQPAVDRLQIRRIPLDGKTDLFYGKELMAGLHL